jgi:hypothetical protein
VAKFGVAGEVFFPCVGRKRVTILPAAAGLPLIDCWYAARSLKRELGSRTPLVVEGC